MSMKLMVGSLLVNTQSWRGTRWMLEGSLTAFISEKDQAGGFELEDLAGLGNEP